MTIKLSQLIFIAVVVNLVLIMANFSIHGQSIETFQSEFNDVIDSRTTLFQNFIDDTQNSDNWFAKASSEVAAAFQQSVNFLIMFAMIFVIIVENIITPGYGVFIQASEIPVLRMIGGFALVYLWWFNIKVILQTISFMKGSSN